ncbi:Hint domain-containing protein [Hasllibacter sp. MH4015]|uniref:Hint domain-containing protein n=1 Tax=Hasllibacter sp. MH4015 TaxID=2854029 RepID=UPI001CD77C1C|nr:Hint domain-containing protein [Hasllibacter sp. MH4015]
MSTGRADGVSGLDRAEAHGACETFVFRDGHGCDVLEGFRPGTDRVTFDMAELSSYEDVRARMSGDGGDTVLTFDNGETLRLKDVGMSDVSASDFTFSAGPFCLHEGTPICTERGEIPIEDLRPDDIVWTKDLGWQAIRLVMFERMTFKADDDPAKPILIPKGALGQDTPHSDLITSPQHRVLRIDHATGEEVLVPAIKLVGQNGVRRMRGRKKAHYLSIVMERHSIIQAAGCWVESMLVTSRSLEHHHRAARALLNRCIGMEPARRVEQPGMRPRRLRRA